MCDYFRLGLNVLDEEAERDAGIDAYEDIKNEFISKEVARLIAKNAYLMQLDDPEYSIEDATEEAEYDWRKKEDRNRAEFEADVGAREFFALRGHGDEYYSNE